MLGLLLSLATLQPYQCGHDKLQHSTNITSIISRSQSKRLLDSEREPIRVLFDYTYIDDPSKLQYGKYCSRSGELVLWSNHFVTCRQEDVMTESYKTMIKETYENIRQYLERTFKVYRSDIPFQLYSDSTYPASTATSDGQTDLYITLYPRPFGPTDPTIASAACVRTEQNTYRPLQGITNINLARLPKTSSGFSTTGDRGLFELALHETCHVLGISSALFEHWKNPETGEEWGASFPRYTVTKYGKSFTVMHTPKLHKLVADRWGKEYFFDDPAYPAGIEMEDYGGQGTAGSHWEFRTYYTELMVGITTAYARISDVTLTALDDTGWYDVDYSQSEMLEWGDYRSIAGKTKSDFENFAVGPPALNWPDHYLVKSRNEIPGSPLQVMVPGCTHDHRSRGVADARLRGVCSGTEEDPCQYPEFYDALDIGYYGNPLFDYLLLFQPAYEVCVWRETGTTARRSMCAKVRSGGNLASGCFEMSCKDGAIRVHYGIESRYCTQPGEELSFTTTTDVIICPDPNVVCPILSNITSGEDPPDQTPAPTKPPDPTKSPKPTQDPDEGSGNSGKLSGGVIAGIVIGVLAFVDAGIFVGIVIAGKVCNVGYFSKAHDGWVAAK